MRVRLVIPIRETTGASPRSARICCAGKEGRRVVSREKAEGRNMGAQRRGRWVQVGGKGLECQDVMG